MQEGTITSPVQQFFRNKWVRVFLTIDILLIITLIAVSIWQNTTKIATINLDIAPTDSTITINGDNRYRSGQYSITPGTYDISVSHEGLDTKSFTIDISPQHVVSIRTFLKSNNDNFDFYKLKANYMSYKKLESIASSSNNVTTDHDTSAENFIQEFQKDYNLFATQLPIEYHESRGYGSDLEILKNITIKASYDCHATLCIQASAAGTNSKDFINSLLEEKGFKVEDFEIEYKFY